MAWTLEQVTTWLISQRKGFMQRVGMDVTTLSANTDLAAPITSALLELGYGVETPLVPTDDDLANIADGGILLFLDVCDLRLLYTIRGNWSKVDEQVASQKKSYDQFAKAVAEEIARLEKNLLDHYGFGVRTRLARIAKINAGRCWPPNPPTVCRPVDRTCCPPIVAPKFIP